MRAGQFFTNAGCGFDEVHSVIVMLGYAGRHGENIRVENDIFGREIKLPRQQIIGALANFKFARCGICLAVLVKRHHNNSRAIALAQPRLFEKVLSAFFQRNRVDDGLALHAFQPGLNDRPF